MEKLKKVLSTQTLKNSSITFSGTVVNALFGAVFYILAARYLGPAGFGLLNVAIMVMTLTSDIGDLGTDTGLVNFVSRFISSEKEKAYKFLKLGLKVKFYVWIFVVLIGGLLSKYIAETIFLKSDLTPPLLIGFAGVLSMLFFSFIIHALQAMQKFWSWSIIQAGTNLLRLFLFLFIFYLGYRTVESSLVVYVVVPMIGFLIGIKTIGKDFLKVKNEWSVAGDFFKYNKWVAAFTLVSAISARMDTFISARLLDSSEVGIYSAANQMVKIVPQIVIALGTVIGPKMAELKSVSEFMAYFKKTQVLVFGLAILGISTIPVVILSIPYIFGTEYLASSGVFVILFFAMIIFLLSVPIHMSVFYYFSYPKLFFYVSFMHLVLVVFLGYFLISVYGVIGAAYTVLIGQIFDFVIPAIFVFSKIKKSR